MHKIKEMLHKDNEDTNVSSSSSSHTTEKHGLFHHSGESKIAREGETFSDRSQFDEKSHVHHHHGEHDADLGHKHVHSSSYDREALPLHEHKHKHQHLHASGDKHKLKDEHLHHHHHGERHIIHERESLKDGGDLYKAGVDPAVHHEILSASRHDGGVVRERIDEGKIVKEAVKEVELHKIQPVIHRDREQKEIRHIVEPHKKVEIKDTEIHHRERDIDLGVRREGSTLETSRSIGHAPHIESTREFLGKERQHQELPIKIEEHVHRKIEEHVHPVIYKEVLKPKVTEETHHIYEKVKEAPIETYEVKEIGISRGEGLREAEREFFARESSRGIVLGEGHSCEYDIQRHGHAHAHSHEHLHTKDVSHKIKDKAHKVKDPHKIKKDKSHKHKHSEGLMDPVVMHSHTHTHAPIHSHGMMAQEPIIGHHQNIGAHHLPAGAVPAGHNMAYDAALADNRSGVISHGARDVSLMQKMDEKRAMQDEKLARTQGAGAHSTVV